MPDPKTVNPLSLTLDDMLAMASEAAASQPPVETQRRLDVLARAIRPGDRDSVAEYLREVVKVRGTIRGDDLTLALAGVASDETVADFLAWITREWPIDAAAEITM